MIKATMSIQRYQFGNQNVEYKLVRSKRRKTSELIVDEDEIILRIPYNKSTNEVEKLVGSKIEWIFRKQKEYKERKPEMMKPNFLQGSSLPYLGEQYQIEIRYTDSNKIEFEKNKFVINLTDTDSGANRVTVIKLLYEDWLYAQAIKIFEEKTRRFAKVIDVKPNKILVKKLKNRWGSATRSGIINLNFNLIKAPENVIDYIIIHELCHLIIKKHSHHFWKLLSKYINDYKRRIEWLEVNGNYLI